MGRVGATEYQGIKEQRKNQCKSLISRELGGAAPRLAVTRWRSTSYETFNLSWKMPEPSDLCRPSESFDFQWITRQLLNVFFHKLGGLFVKNFRRLFLTHQQLPLS